MSYFPVGAAGITVVKPALDLVDVARPSERVTATPSTGQQCPEGTGTGYVLDKGAWRRARCGEVGQPVASHTLDWRDAQPTAAGAGARFPWALAAAAGGAILVVLLLRRRRRKETV